MSLISGSSDTKCFTVLTDFCLMFDGNMNRPKMFSTDISCQAVVVVVVVVVLVVCQTLAAFDWDDLTSRAKRE